MLDGWFLETAAGRTPIPAEATAKIIHDGKYSSSSETTLPGGRVLKISARSDGTNISIHLAAQPDSDILKWGVGVPADDHEYFTGIMERVVDGPQQASWAPNLSEALNLRGQKITMILKPTMSVYSPFYLSSRGYGLAVGGNWPGYFDFCATDPQRVKVEFEGPAFDLKIYTAHNPAALVSAHALDAGPPFLPPKWMYTPWRWRDEITQRRAYYDGTPVTGPWNSEFMEDMLMMKAYGIPCGVYWIDRPWGPGAQGYDDFEIDTNRLPNFPESVKWLTAQDTKMFMWIRPFYQGQMETNALARGYNLAGQKPSRNDYPMVDMTNPDAKAYWQDGVAKLLKMDVAGFKLDRGEENMPESGPFKTFDGRSIRENRNAYPPMYLKAAYDIAQKYRGQDFRALHAALHVPAVLLMASFGVGILEACRKACAPLPSLPCNAPPSWAIPTGVQDTGGYARSRSWSRKSIGRWLAFRIASPPSWKLAPPKISRSGDLPREAAIRHRTHRHLAASQHVCYPPAPITVTRAAA